MIGLIGSWVRALTGAALLCTMALALCPKGAPRRVLNSAAACVMALALLSPAAKPAAEGFARAFAQYSEDAREITDSAEAAAGSYERRVIESELEAYIMDRAEGLDAELSGASVALRWSEEGYWYPWECRLEGPAANAELSGLIEAELGIPEARQYWEVSA